MVLKGCTKRVIILKNTDSDLFDEAVFFLKPGKDNLCERDYLSEANNLVSRHTVISDCTLEDRIKNTKAKSRGFLQFAIGIAVGAVAMLILF